MRLPKFILKNVEPILAHWETYARSLAPGAKMTKLALRDNAKEILVAIAQDMQVEQIPSQQTNKSKGQGGAGGALSDNLDDASARRGSERVGAGFNITEVVSEYRALRATVLRLWRASLPQPGPDDIDDITRFNESLDQSLAQAIGSYTSHVDRSRRMFLGILSHDLRNPLHSIRMAAVVVSLTANDDPEAAAYALEQIEANMKAITQLIDDLIDFASTGLGNSMPLTCEPVNLEKLCREVVDAVCIANPGRTLGFYPDGELSGNWDSARLRQVLTNLMSNAIQHGSHESPVELRAVSEGSTVVLSVHNDGTPIPAELVATIFDPLVRQETPDTAEQGGAGNIGLGLYIVHEIVVAHGGTVDVASTAEAGTTFTVRLPRMVNAISPELMPQIEI